MAGQIAKALGCRTVGVTGGPDKARACREAFGFDAVIDYKAAGDGLGAALDSACPEGVDCFFDNVGGQQFDRVLERINVGARIAICGTIGMPSLDWKRRRVGTECVSKCRARWSTDLYTNTQN